MNITRFAIEKRVVTSVLIALVLIAGMMTYFSLPRAEDPGFTVRVRPSSRPRCPGGFA